MCKLSIGKSLRLESYCSIILVKVALIAALSSGLSIALKTYLHIDLNSNVICLVFGVLAHQVGFLESDVLTKAGVYN